MYALIIISLLGIVLLYVGLLRKPKLLMPVGVAGLLAALMVSGFEVNLHSRWFNNMLMFNDLALAFSASMILLCIALFLLSKEYYIGVELHLAENYALFCFALSGGILLTSFTNLIMLFLGLEILSIPLYILAGAKKKSLRSNEASFKYYLLGSFASAFLLLGITLIYGQTASFFLADIHYYNLVHLGNLHMVYKLGVLFLLFGLAFKLAASPFHFWTPDVYEGSPSLVTAFMATIVKIASFAALWRLFSLSLMPLFGSLEKIMWILIILSLIIGNVTALWQQNFKRFIAYSGIGNTGFMLILLLTNDQHVGKILFFYLLVYAISVIISFYGFYVVKRHTGNKEDLGIFYGLWYRNKLIAISMIGAMFSFAGIPVFAGFWAKYFVLLTAVDHQLIILTIIAIVLSLVGAYYYLSVSRIILSPARDSSIIRPTLLSKVVVSVLLISIVILGCYPFIMNYV